MGERIHDWVDVSLGPKYESFLWEVLIRVSRTLEGMVFSSLNDGLSFNNNNIDVFGITF